MESYENVDTNIVFYATRLAERTIERALDVIYEQSNQMDPKLYEWRHSIDKINVVNN